MGNNKPMVLVVLLGFTLCISLEDAMLRLVNDYRGSRNMDTLYCLEALQKAADYQAQVMCTTGRLTHEGIDKYHHALDDRLRMFDFVGENIGENIARQENDEYAEVFKLWVKSSEHRKNILGDYTYTGISTCRNKSGYRFWIQVFGKDVSNSFIRTLRFKEMGSFSGKNMDGANVNSLCPITHQELGSSTAAQKNSELSDGYLSARDGQAGGRRCDMNSYGGVMNADASRERASESVQNCRDKSSRYTQNTGNGTNGFIIDESTRRSLQEQVARIVVDILQAGIIQGLKFFGLTDRCGISSKQADGMYPQENTNVKKKGMLEEMDVQFSKMQQERDQGVGTSNKKRDTKETPANRNIRETVHVDKSNANTNENGSGGAFRDSYSNDTNAAINRGEINSQTSEMPQQIQGEGQILDAGILNQSGQNFSSATNINNREREKQPQSYGQSQKGEMEKCTVDKFCKKIDIGIPLYLGAQWSEKR
eukprot:jgi/Antlo1/1629/1841